MASRYMFAGVLCVLVVLASCGKLPHDGGEQYGGQQGGGAVEGRGGQASNYGGEQSAGQGGPNRAELVTGPDVFGYDSTFPGGKANLKSHRGERRARSANYQPFRTDCFPTRRLTYPYHHVRSNILDELFNPPRPREDINGRYPW